MKERSVLYYHNDLDGVMSAAGYLIGTSTSAALRPARSKYRQSLLQTRPEGFTKVIVLDYAFSKFADLWIDHHRYEKFKWSEGAEVHFNPNAKSSFEIVCQLYGVGDLDIISEVNKHDSAEYDDFNYVFRSLDSSNVLRAYIEQATSDLVLNNLVRELVNNGLDMAAAISNLEIDGAEVLNKDLEKIDRCLELFSMVNGVGVLFVEENDAPPRYAEYFKFPDMKYCVKYTRTGSKYTVRLSTNPIMDSDVSMSDVLIASNVANAGGHYAIAGGVISAADEPEVTVSIIKHLGVLYGEVCS